MRSIEKILVIEDDPKIRQKLGTILEFLGEECTLLDSSHLSSINWALPWGGCILGSLQQERFPFDWMEKLSDASQIPLLQANQQPYSLEVFPQFLGVLNFPLNYLQLSDALRHCKEFIGRRNLSTVIESKSTKLFRSLVGKSQNIQKIRYLIEQVAATEARVLILGESGTGKEVVARNIHYYSARRHGPFVPINCGAIPADLLESELFGHEKGAFTGAIAARKGRFELAEGGTLFLDEVGDMPMNMQVKLLRVLQERCFERVGGSTTIKADVRIIAATHRNLDEMLDEQRFREDLFYRLNVFPIEMPALNERKEDIPLLIQEILQRLESESGGTISFTPRALHSLMEHDWPGNVRELANLLERMLILHPNSLIDVNHLPAKYRYNAINEFKAENLTLSIEEQEQEVLASVFSEQFALPVEVAQSLPYSLPAEGIDLKEVLTEIEMNFINQALDVHNGVVSRAAEMLGMRRTTLVEKMRKYDIQR